MHQQYDNKAQQARAVEGAKPQDKQPMAKTMKEMNLAVAIPPTPAKTPVQPIPAKTTKAAGPESKTQKADPAPTKVEPIDDKVIRTVQETVREFLTNHPTQNQPNLEREFDRQTQKIAGKNVQKDNAPSRFQDQVRQNVVVRQTETKQSNLNRQQMTDPVAALLSGNPLRINNPTPAVPAQEDRTEKREQGMRVERASPGVDKQAPGLAAQVVTDEEKARVRQGEAASKNSALSERNASREGLEREASRELVVSSRNEKTGNASAETTQTERASSERVRHPETPTRLDEATIQRLAQKIADAPPVEFAKTFTSSEPEVSALRTHEKLPPEQISRDIQTRLEKESEVSTRWERVEKAAHKEVREDQNQNFSPVQEVELTEEEEELLRRRRRIRKQRLAKKKAELAKKKPEQRKWRRKRMKRKSRRERARASRRRTPIK